MARVKKKDYENLTSTNIEKVIAHLTADQPISKKEACGMLNIAYNTARLQRIIDDHEDKKLYRAKRKAQNKGRAASSAEIAKEVAVVGSGEAASAIGCRGREGAHLGILANRKNVTVAGEPVGFAFAVFFIVFLVAEIENLAFDTFREPAFASTEFI